MLDERETAELLRTFDLGEGSLSAAPCAAGHQGLVWRLESTSGSWAVKSATRPPAEEDVVNGAAFQEAAAAAGITTPAVRRTTTGAVTATIGAHRIRVHSWVDLDPPSAGLDAAGVGALLGRLHQVDHRGSSAHDRWFTDPVGAPTWDELVATAGERRAPFAADLAALRDELVALEALMRPPTTLRTCHRDLFADNVRSTPGGGLCVFDFDSTGDADPSYELACALVEFATDDPVRARPLRDSYRDAGGPGRVTGPASFSMAVAQLGHIAEMGCRRWLAATSDEGRAEEAAWVAELTSRPLTRALIGALLEA